MKLTKSQREALFQMFGGRCAYCGHELPAKGWHADHVEPCMRKFEFARDKHGMTITKATGEFWQPENNRIDNFLPSCRACNLHKHCMGLESWRKYLSEQVRMCRDYSAPFRHAERFGLVLEVVKPIVFYFEQVAAQ